MTLRPVWGSMASGAMGEASHRLLPIPCKAAQRAHGAAATRVAKPCSLLCLQGVVQAGRRGHVLQVRERLEYLHNLAHQRPGLWVPGETGTGQLGHLVSAFHGMFPPSFGSIRAWNPCLCFRWGRAHSTRLCSPVGRFLSIDRLPVMSSSSTTPKLYTSLLDVK